MAPWNISDTTQMQNIKIRNLILTTRSTENMPFAEKAGTW